MSSLSDRIKWVLYTERQFSSVRKWALKTDGVVHPNTLSDLKHGKVENPETETIQALARAAGLREAWLHYGDGPPREEKKQPPDRYPSRSFVVAGLRAGGAPSEVVDELLAVERWPNDPGFTVWLRLAADLLDEFERNQRQFGVTG